jgi:hypothetical protein
MKLARAGYLSDVRFGSWQWTHGDGTKASIQITGDRQAVTLDYRVKAGGEDWQTVHQRIRIRWTPCRFGGERPWFVCDVSSDGVYCGRCVAKLYGAGRLFACRPVSKTILLRSRRTPELPALSTSYVPTCSRRYAAPSVHASDSHRPRYPGSCLSGKLCSRESLLEQARKLTEPYASNGRQVVVVFATGVRGFLVWTV